MRSEARRRTPLLTRSNIPLIVGSLIVAVYLTLTAVGPWIAPYGQADVVGDVWEAPSAQFWLGTDNLGRDTLSRLLYGTQTTLVICLAGTALAFLGGAVLGTISAIFHNGRVDWILGQIVDVVMAFPVLILALVLISVIGPSVLLIIAIIAVVHGARVYRVARSVAVNITAMDFIEVCRLRRDPLPYVIFREILPNAAPALAAEYGVRLNFAVLFLSSLSFLGLGIQPPAADWGSMVRENAEAIAYGLAVPLYPALALMILSFGVNLVVDWTLERTTQGGTGAA